MKSNFSHMFMRIFKILNSQKNECSRRQENECHLRTTKAREVDLASFCREASGLAFAYFRYISVYGSLQNCNELFQNFMIKKY